MAKVVWTETSITDLDDIAAYISLDSAFYAKQFIAKIFLATDKLEKQPEIGKVVPELPNTNYREILYKRYRIIYRYFDNKVFIITVHHSSRLLENSAHFKSV